MLAGSRSSRSSFCDGVDRLAEREARRQVERDRHRRLLALVIDLQRPDRRHEMR